MSNAEIVERCLEAISNRDVATMKQLSAPDIEIRPLRAMLEDTAYHGHTGIDEWLRDMNESWAELRLETHEIRETGPGTVVSEVTIHGRGDGSQAPTHMRVEMVAELTDGLVTRASIATAGS